MMREMKNDLSLIIFNKNTTFINPAVLVEIHVANSIFPRRIKKSV